MSEFPYIVEKPSDSVRQISGKNPAGKVILGVVAKVRYKIEGGRCVSPGEAKLLDEPKFSDDGFVMEEEADLFADKLGADFFIKGKVYGKGRAIVDAEVEIAGRKARWRVTGDRVVEADGADGIRFSTPQPIEEIEISYRNAYGGIAEHAEKTMKPSWDDVFPPYSVPDDVKQPWSSPFGYPRNPAGKGYVIGKGIECAVGVALPNIENADALLTPEKLICPDLLSWPLMPMPAAVGPMSYEWFPRCGHCNMVPHYHESIKTFGEVERGHATADIIDPAQDSPEGGHRFACAAGWPLQLPVLRGGESVSSREIGGAGKKIDFVLPAAPRMWTDGRKGSLKPAEVTIDSVTLDAEKDEVTIVWRGRAEALRVYLPEELAKMPLRVEFT